MNVFCGELRLKLSYKGLKSLFFRLSVLQPFHFRITLFSNLALVPDMYECTQHCQTNQAYVDQ